MKFSTSVIAVLVLLLCATSHAECGSNFCENVKIQEMQVTYDGIVWIQTTGTETNLQNCVPQGGSVTPFIRVDANTIGGKNLYSALLSAQARDKSFLVRTRDGVSPCEIHYISVN